MDYKGAYQDEGELLDRKEQEEVAKNSKKNIVTWSFEKNTAERNFEKNTAVKKFEKYAVAKNFEKNTEFQETYVTWNFEKNTGLRTRMQWCDSEACGVRASNCTDMWEQEEEEPPIRFLSESSEKTQVKSRLVETTELKEKYVKRRPAITTVSGSPGKTTGLRTRMQWCNSQGCGVRASNCTDESEQEEEEPPIRFILRRPAISTVRRRPVETTEFEETYEKTTEKTTVRRRPAITTEEPLKRIRFEDTLRNLQNE